MLRPVLLTSFLLALSSVACGGAVEPVPSPSESTSSSGGPTTSTGSSSGGGASGGTVPEPGPVPAANLPTWNDKASGCGNVVIFSPDKTGRRFLVIRADAQRHGLTKIGETATLDLATSDDEEDVLRVDTFATAPNEAPYCTDIGGLDKPTSVASPVRGTITFTVTRYTSETSYGVDVKLEGVVVETGSSSERLPDLTFRNVGVGWLPG